MDEFDILPSIHCFKNFKIRLTLKNILYLFRIEQHFVSLRQIVFHCLMLDFQRL